MDDFLLIMLLLLINGSFAVISMVIMRYQFDQAILLIDKQLSNKMKTFGATLARSKGSDREPSNLETIVGLGQTFLALKQEGVSIKDILAEFGMSVAQETVKAAVSSTETPEG